MSHGGTWSVVMRGVIWFETQIEGLDTINDSTLQGNEPQGV